MSWLPDWLTGYDAANAARAAQADAELRRLNQAKIDSGDYTSEQLAATRRNYATDAYLDDTAARNAIDESFDQGWQEGRQNVSGFIKGAINRIVADPLRAVIGGLPWWLWLVAGLAVFGYFGGFSWLKRKLA